MSTTQEIAFPKYRGSKCKIYNTRKVYFRYINLTLNLHFFFIYLFIYLFILSRTRSRRFDAETGDAELICADAECPQPDEGLNLRFQLVLIHEAVLRWLLSRRRSLSEIVDVILNNFRFTQNLNDTTEVRSWTPQSIM